MFCLPIHEKQKDIILYFSIFIYFLPFYTFDFWLEYYCWCLYHKVYAFFLSSYWIFLFLYVGAGIYSTDYFLSGTNLITILSNFNFAFKLENNTCLYILAKFSYNKDIFFFFLNFLLFIGEQSINNVVVISGEQWRNSGIHIHVFILPHWCEKLIHLKRPWCWERLRTGEGDTVKIR